MADFAPTHPGEILLTEFLEPMGISQYRIAKAIDVPPRRINEIVHGKRGISADTGLRLSRALGLSDMFWINMQAHYDAEIAREHLADGARHDRAYRLRRRARATRRRHDRRDRSLVRRGSLNTGATARHSGRYRRRPGLRISYGG